MIDLFIWVYRNSGFSCKIVLKGFGAIQESIPLPLDHQAAEIRQQSVTLSKLLYPPLDVSTEKKDQEKNLCHPVKTVISSITYFHREERSRERFG